MVGLGAFSWEGRGWGVRGGCGDLVNKSAENNSLGFSI